MAPSSRYDPLALPDLPTSTRILASVLGWLLILVGIAGLVLPGLQGILTLLAGAALLSLVSHTALRALRWCMRPWPMSWRRLLRLRQKLIARLAPDAEHDEAERDEADGEGLEGEDPDSREPAREGGEILAEDVASLVGCRGREAADVVAANLAAASDDSPDEEEEPGRKNESRK